MSTLTHDSIWQAIARLNNLYGRGEVETIDFVTMRYCYKPYMCQSQWRSFKVKSNTVYACNHQMSITSNK